MHDHDDLNGYHKWLGIPEEKCPPTHYDLLAISLNEDDSEVIRSVAEQRRRFVESKRGHGHDAVVTQILYHIDEAELTLLNPEMRRDYDRRMNLFQKRHRSRQFDPAAKTSGVQSRPGPAVGEESGIVRTFVGIMAVLLVGMMIMAWFSFHLPWNKPAEPKQGPDAAVITVPERPEPAKMAREEPDVAAPLLGPQEVLPLAAAPFDADSAIEYQKTWADHRGVPVDSTNSIGMKFRLIPPGTFTMGSPQTVIDELLTTTNDSGWQDRYRNETEHQVTLTKPFYLGVYEVTQSQYEEVMGANPSAFSAGGRRANEVAGLDTADFPVEMMSWFDAVDFCIKLSEREGLKPCYSREDEKVTLLDGNGYRLPTEAEWEFACRAGTPTRWSHGDDEEQLAQFCWYGSNSGRRPHAVGTRRPNPFGIFDMHGNVWEWCQDADGPPDGAVAVTDPVGSLEGDRHRTRGGSYNFGAIQARSACRSTVVTDRHFPISGFRVAGTIDAGPNTKTK